VSLAFLMFMYCVLLVYDNTVKSSLVILQKCYEYYTSGEISVGDDGVDEQCRWCAQGGKLVGCDFCHNAFCKSCIKSNLGRSELAATSGVLSTPDITAFGDVCYVALCCVILLYTLCAFQ